MKPIKTFLYSKKKSSWIKLSELKSGFLYKNKYKIDLLTGEKTQIGVDELIQRINSTKIFSVKNHHITHLFYEFGNYINDIEVGDEAILAVDLVYKKKQTLKLDYKYNDNFISYDEGESSNYSDYVKKIRKIKNDIREGAYYQLNYTKNWKYKTQSRDEDVLHCFLGSKNKHSILSHATILPILKMTFLTNTPECLFQVLKTNKGNNYLVESFPMKGTLKMNGDSTKQINKLKNDFIKSAKNSAELDMISDLIRNDLVKFQYLEEKCPDADIVKRRLFMKVPGLLQQLSHVRATAFKKFSIGKLIYSLFPGGSITGAPKISSMQKIIKLEDSQRGFYCGTTLYHSKRQCCASINIRSICLGGNGEITVGAGGGITLKSKVNEEWNEMNSKIKSIMSLLS